MPPSSSSTVLLIHGYMDGGETWDRLINRLRSTCGRLAEATYVAPTLHEAVPPPRTSAATLEHYRDQVLAALAQQPGDGDVIVVGHSMGGAIAELVAATLGGRASRLILVTPVPLAGAKLSLEARLPFVTGLENRSPERMRAARLAWSRNLDDEALDMMTRTAERVSGSGALQQFNAWDGGHPLGEMRSSLVCPVLMITTEDPFFSRDLLTAQAKRFSGGVVRHVAGAGHWSHVEQPDALADEICRFVSA